MAKGYRNQMTPGLKKCIDYMKGSKMKEEKPNLTNKPPAYNFGDGGNAKTK